MMIETLKLSLINYQNRLRETNWVDCIACDIGDMVLATKRHLAQFTVK